MTRDDITRMFHEAGQSAGWKPGFGNQLVINYLTHFAALVAAAEREACARVAEEPVEFTSPEASRIAAAIRSRGQA